MFFILRLYLSAQAELRKIDGKTGMNLTSFKKFTQHHHGVMFPAFQLQHQLQRSVLGVGFWHRASERRVQLSKGKYVTLSELMRMVRQIHYYCCCFYSHCCYHYYTNV